MTDATVLDTLRRVNRAMVRADSSAALERSVCELFAESAPYRFAWIGVVDEGSGDVVPRARAGPGAGYLDDVSITADGSATGRGPTGRAVRTGEVQVVRDVDDDPTFAPWIEAARERGFRSSIAIPLVYEDERHGVLNVYADRPDAFDAAERELLADVGETIGYALHNFEARARRRRQYANLFEDAPLMYVLTRNEDGTPIVDDCNRRFLTKLGYEEEAVVGRDLGEFYTDESAERLRSYGYDRALADEFVREERDFVTADGETLPTRMRAVPRVGADGDVTGTLVLYRDVTERKQAAAVLRHARLLDASMDGIAVFNTDGECVHANDAFVSLLGYESAGDVEGEPYGTFLAAAERERFRTDVLSAVAEGGTWRGETRGRRATGETFPAEVSLTDVEGVGVGAIVRDVSDRRERERRLRDLRRQYETVFQNAQDALFLIDVEDADTFRIIRFSSHEEELTGLVTGDPTGETVEAAFVDEVSDELRARYRTCVETAEPATYEAELSLPEGTRYWQTKLAPVVVDGEVTELVGASRDITALREYERQLETQRDQLELLNRIVRHDIRNDMSVVLGFAERLRDRVDPEHRDDVDRIRGTGRHTVELTETARDLVEMIRRTAEPEIEPTDLDAALRDEFENTERSYPRATFRLGEVPDVDVRANDLLSAVFRNLLHNAVQHNDGDEPRVEVSVTERADGEWVRVSVADDGPGIPAHRRDEVFGKESKGLESPGTGMGLYVVDSLVDQYGGSVRVEDREGGGSVFHVDLRTAEGRPQ
jgi:PAS domain S-box-containing protein